MSETMLFVVEGGLAHVTLNRPASLNAINPDAARRWREVAAEIAARDDIRVVLLDANGPAFCAGGDVLEMAGLGGAGDASNARRAGSASGAASVADVGDSASADALARPGGADPGLTGRMVRELADTIHEGHRILQESAKPIVAAVQGAVAGGGLGFMLVADVIVASDRARFVSKYADIGLTPDCGVSTLLPEAIGMRRALELALSPRSLSAAEALDWGLVTEVVAPDALDARAREIAAYWLAGATGAFGQARRLLRGGVGRRYQDALDDEARTIGAAVETPDATARIAAFAAASSKASRRGEQAGPAPTGQPGPGLAPGAGPATGTLAGTAPAARSAEEPPVAPGPASDATSASASASSSTGTSLGTDIDTGTSIDTSTGTDTEEHA